MTAEAASADQQLSSLVWICTSTHSISKVTVIDANNPADVLECFHVCSSHLLCIASVPGMVTTVPRDPSRPLVSNVTLSHVLVTLGAKEDDYEASEEPSKTRAEEPTPAETSSTKKEEAVEAGGQGEERRVSDIGSISFVSCATGEEAMATLGGNQETEEGKTVYFHKYFCSCFLFVYFSILLFVFQRERQD